MQDNASVFSQLPFPRSVQLYCVPSRTAPIPYRQALDSAVPHALLQVFSVNCRLWAGWGFACNKHVLIHFCLNSDCIFMSCIQVTCSYVWQVYCCLLLYVSTTIPYTSCNLWIFYVNCSCSCKELSTMCYNVYLSLIHAALTCPPDKPLVSCFADPCMFATCPAHPDAVCVADYCGGCNARFFIGNNEVTATCSKNDDEIIIMVMFTYIKKQLIAVIHSPPTLSVHASVAGRVSSHRPDIQGLRVSLPCYLHHPQPYLYTSVCGKMCVSCRTGYWWEEEWVCPTGSVPRYKLMYCAFSCFNCNN